MPLTAIDCDWDWMTPYLVDRDTAGIVLVIALGEDQLSGNVIPAARMRAGGGRRRWKVIA